MSSARRKANLMDHTMTLQNGALARLARAEQDIQKLDVEKADAKDVQALARSFDSLRSTLQWFMGIIATAVVAFAAIIVQFLGA
jgi:Tfp pilus assembly protein PilX